MASNILHFLLSLIMIFGIGWLISYNKRGVKLRFVVQILVIEIVLAWVLLYSQAGVYLISGLSGVFTNLMSYARVGTDFVFGGLVNDNQFSFFLFVLCPIIFISALIGILQHLRILPLMIKGIGYLLSKINGMPRLESFNAVSSLLVGQSENFIAIKDIVPHLNERRMYTLSATAISTVSMSIVGSYMTLLEPRYVMLSLILNMLSTFAVLQVVNPYSDEADNEMPKLNVPKHSFVEMLGEYIMAGFKMAMIVAAMLVGFNALLAMVNAIFLGGFGKSFQDIIGYLFYPVAWLTGIVSHDSLTAGSIMGTKIVANEFVAMLQMKDLVAHLEPRTVAILSVFLVSFANISTVGIIAGAVKSIEEVQGNMVARAALRLLIGATLVSLLSASIVGLVYR